MRLQSSQSLCGAAALANALRAVGVHKATEDRIVDVIKKSADSAEGTPASEGIGPPQLERAANFFHYTLEPVTLNHTTAAYHLIRGSILDKRPCLLAVDHHRGDAGHWVAAIGVLGDWLLIADSANDEIVVPYAWQPLSFRCKSDTDPSSIYALILTRVWPARKKKV